MSGRASLRVRLTLSYAALMVIGAGLLALLNYNVVSRVLPDDKIVISTLRPDEQPPDMSNGPSLDGVTEGAPVPGTVFHVTVNGHPEDPSFITNLPGTIRARTLRYLLVRSLMGLFGVATIAILLSWWLAGRALRPLHRITDAARRLSDETLHERIALDGPHDELRELADTFDAMLERLDTAFDAQSRFVANASHELRTPLAIMRTQLEVARTPGELVAASHVVQQVIERSERLLDGLLVLARAGNRLSTQPVDLGDIVRAASSHVDSHGREITMTCDAGGAPVTGDPALLQHLARNLLDNAHRHNVAAGWVRVVTHRVGDTAVLEVTNSGRVIDDEATEALFEPFRRLGADRTGGADGSGLGLSIVRAVARAHGGDATARALPGGGLCVTVTLPANRTSDPGPVVPMSRHAPAA